MPMVDGSLSFDGECTVSSIDLLSKIIRNFTEKLRKKTSKAEIPVEKKLRRIYYRSIPELHLTFKNFN